MWIGPFWSWFRLSKMDNFPKKVVLSGVVEETGQMSSVVSLKSDLELFYKISG
jgi:hypothetical protein